jgi:alpha-ribazole phosphatase
MNLLLIRHTKPIIENGICYGQKDVPLHFKSYLKKRKNIYKKIQELNIRWDWIYSSPLIRCKYLAIYLQKKLKIPLYYNDDLKEFSYGLWEGKPYIQIEKEFKQWANFFIEQPAPEGESLNSFLNRIKNIYEFLKSQKKNIIIITHIGVIRGFYLYDKKLSINEYFNFFINYGEFLLL